MEKRNPQEIDPETNFPLIEIPLLSNKRICKLRAYLFAR